MMMEYLSGNCTKTKTYKVGDLMTKYQQWMSLDGDETFKMFFANAKASVNSSSNMMTIQVKC